MSDQTFTLHKQLAADTRLITELELCMVLLINDSSYPWTVLVPKRAGATEIYKLDSADQIQLLQESSKLCRAMESVFQPDKMNVAAIGNMVPQLHVHHIARFKTDTAWPAPVWGFAQAVPYETAILDNTIASVKNALQDTI